MSVQAAYIEAANQVAIAFVAVVAATAAFRQTDSCSTEGRVASREVERVEAVLHAAKVAMAKAEGALYASAR